MSSFEAMYTHRTSGDNVKVLVIKDCHESPMTAYRFENGSMLGEERFNQLYERSDDQEAIDPNLGGYVAKMVALGTGDAADFIKQAKEDLVNHPKHYTSHPSGIECIDVTEHMNFNCGNAVKYLWRTDHKNGIEDLKKARWYTDREIKRLSEEG